MMHLIKLSVGVSSPAHLRELQDERRRLIKEREGRDLLRHITRHHPRRAEEILAGGSIYWVIRGVIQMRQRILDFESFTDGEGQKRCAIMLDPQLVPVQPHGCRAFQGWRYLDPGEAPPDQADGDETGALPAEMAAELRELGLL